MTAPGCPVDYVIVGVDDVHLAVFAAVVAGFILRDGLYAVGGWLILAARAMRRRARRRRLPAAYRQRPIIRGRPIE